MPYYRHIYIWNPSCRQRFLCPSKRDFLKKCKIPPANTLKSPLPPHTTALLTTTCKPGQPHRVHTCKHQGEFSTLLTTSGRARPRCHPGRFLHTRLVICLQDFSCDPPDSKHTPRDQHTQEFVNSKSWTLSPPPAMPGWPGQCCTSPGISLHPLPVSGERDFHKEMNI